MIKIWHIASEVIKYVSVNPQSIYKSIYICIYFFDLSPKTWSILEKVPRALGKNVYPIFLI